MKQKGTGNAEFLFFDENEYKKISLKWNYPNIEHKFNGSKEAAKQFKNALSHLSKVINSDEYKNDFGNNSYINPQLESAIEYLGSLSNQND